MKLINKAFSILDLFLEHGDELALEDLSRLSGLNKATVRRIAVSLIECGCLKQSQKRGKYSLGMRFLDFSGAIKRYKSIIPLATPHLIRLNQEVNETTFMALWDGTKVVLCQSFHANHPLKVDPEEGAHLAMHCTSVGKAILAELEEKELETCLKGQLKTFTPNTITDLNELKKHLKMVKQQGLAFDDEEFEPGVRGIGVALKSGKGSLIGGVGVIGPSVRLSWDRLREIIPSVQECSACISREMGWKNFKNK